MSEQRVFGVTGWKNSGKTTLVCKLVREITSRGFTVSTIKHAHETFDMDHPGRDSHEHRLSGAQEVAISSKMRWAVLHELRGDDEPSLNDMLTRLTPVDLVIIEGYKREPHAKIECRRVESRSQEEIAPMDANVVAIARDHEISGDLPNFDIDDINALTDFVLNHVGLISNDNTGVHDG